MPFLRKKAEGYCENLNLIPNIDDVQRCNYWSKDKIEGYNQAVDEHKDLLIRLLNKIQDELKNFGEE